MPVATGPDYDVKHFDPSAYVSKATAEIQKLAPGAKLTSIEFEHVGSDGRVDLTKVTQFHTFGFRVARPVLPDALRTLGRLGALEVRLARFLLTALKGRPDVGDPMKVTSVAASKCRHVCSE